MAALALQELALDLDAILLNTFSPESLPYYRQYSDKPCDLFQGSGYSTLAAPRLEESSYFYPPDLGGHFPSEASHDRSLLTTPISDTFLRQSGLVDIIIALSSPLTKQPLQLDQPIMLHRHVFGLDRDTPRLAIHQSKLKWVIPGGTWSPTSCKILRYAAEIEGIFKPLPLIPRADFIVDGGEVHYLMDPIGDYMPLLDAPVTLRKIGLKLSYEQCRRLIAQARMFLESFTFGQLPLLDGQLLASFRIANIKDPHMIILPRSNDYEDLITFAADDVFAMCVYNITACAIPLAYIDPTKQPFEVFPWLNSLLPTSEDQKFLEEVKALAQQPIRPTWPQLQLREYQFPDIDPSSLTNNDLRIITWFINNTLDQDYGPVNCKKYASLLDMCMCLLAAKIALPAMADADDRIVINTFMDNLAQFGYVRGVVAPASPAGNRLYWLPWSHRHEDAKVYASKYHSRYNQLCLELPSNFMDSWISINYIGLGPQELAIPFRTRVGIATRVQASTIAGYRYEQRVRLGLAEGKESDIVVPEEIKQQAYQLGQQAETKVCLATRWGITVRGKAAMPTSLPSFLARPAHEILPEYYCFDTSDKVEPGFIPLAMQIELKASQITLGTNIVSAEAVARVFANTILSIKAQLADENEQIVVPGLTDNDIKLIVDFLTGRIMLIRLYLQLSESGFNALSPVDALLGIYEWPSARYDLDRIYVVDRPFVDQIKVTKDWLIKRHQYMPSFIHWLNLF